MKGALAFLLVALAAASASSVPSFVGSIQGVYKTRHQIAMYDTALAPADQHVAVEDVMEIVAQPGGAAYVRLHLTFDNGHLCGLHGIAEPEGDALVYRPRDNIEGPCALSLRSHAGRLVFGDADDACKFDFCGARGILNGAGFPLSSRRPIRYLPRLLASREYAEARAERGLPTPPPRVAVKVAPMHTDGSVPRYPRLTVFPDSAIRAKVNALLAQTETEARSDRDDCLANLREHHRSESGPYDVRIDVAYVTPRYISMQVRRSDNCGRSYPNNGVPSPLTIDLSTAQEVNWQWVFKQGFLYSPGGSQNDGRLAALYRQRYASVRGKDAECRQAVGDARLNFSLRLDASRGLMAEPSLPHAVQACAEEIALSPKEVAPFVQDARFLADLNATVHP
ncbi:MAG TPA: hypothetical protein VIM02_12475 [Rhizomicrobium sp.]|jgi:hypothetical protein